MNVERTLACISILRQFNPSSPALTTSPLPECDGVRQWMQLSIITYQTPSISWEMEKRHVRAGTGTDAVDADTRSGTDPTRVGSAVYAGIASITCALDSGSSCLSSSSGSSSGSATAGGGASPSGCRDTVMLRNETQRQTTAARASSGSSSGSATAGGGASPSGCRDTVMLRNETQAYPNPNFRPPGLDRAQPRPQSVLWPCCCSACPCADVERAAGAVRVHAACGTREIATTRRENVRKQAQSSFHVHPTLHPPQLKPIIGCGARRTAAFHGH
ncbi:hypothetical protein B0H14DRAFT_2616162 [Mycena olivaceomarginata]|nr:hypothetical protein B0H14DRAFT_2616162 [Mycena olivaceomarginata]